MSCSHRHHPWIAGLIVLALLATLLVVDPAVATGRKLNPPLPTGDSVVDFVLSPDGSQVVYRAGQRATNTYELYSVPVAGPASATTKLNPSLVANGSVFNVQISPDGSRVVYRAFQDTDGPFELYSVPVAGPASAATKLNPPLVANASVITFQFSPDGSRVVYVADQDTDGAVELYSVPVDGPASASIKLNPPFVANDRVSTFQFSPDGSRVVYRADQDTDGHFELYSVPAVGPASASIKLNPTLGAGAIAGSFQFSPDSSRVVYLVVPFDHNSISELYSVPIAGPASVATKLNRTLDAQENVFSFQISPDGSRVVYMAGQFAAGPFELYSVPIAGPASAATTLNSPLVTNGSVGLFQFSPDGSQVVYMADQDIDQVVELYVSDLARRPLRVFLPSVLR